MTITMSNPFQPDRVFEVVEKIQSSYQVWNIGKYMGYDDYIPFCQLLPTGDCDIDPSSLKAVKLDPAEVMLLREAAHRGVNSKKTAQRTINRCAKSKAQQYKKQLAIKALLIFERITEEA